MAYDLFCAQQCNVCWLLHDSGADSSSDDSCNSFPTRDKLHKCNGCKLILYCGGEHQRLDWPIHKNFCKAVQKICKVYHVRHPFLLNGEIHDQKTLETSILQVKYMLRTCLDRPLQYHEEELTSFPEYCQVCFSFGCMRLLCDHCKAVAYCSESHKRADALRHHAQCALLQLYYCPYKVQILYRPPYELEHSFSESKVVNLKGIDLIRAFEDSTQQNLPKNPMKSLDDYQLFSFAADFSCISTICYALSFMDMDPKYKNKKFVLFVIGATVEQELWFQVVHTQFFFRQYPHITNLELYFIGPELKATEETYKTICYDFLVSVFSYLFRLEDDLL